MCPDTPPRAQGESIGDRQLTRAYWDLSARPRRAASCDVMESALQCITVSVGFDRHRSNLVHASALVFAIHIRRALVRSRRSREDQVGHLLLARGPCGLGRGRYRTRAGSHRQCASSEHARSHAPPLLRANTAMAYAAHIPRCGLLFFTAFIDTIARTCHNQRLTRQAASTDWT